MEHKDLGAVDSVNVTIPTHGVFLYGVSPAHEAGSGLNEQVGSDGRPITAAILRRHCEISRNRNCTDRGLHAADLHLGRRRSEEDHEERAVRKTEDGQPVDLYTLSNNNRMEAAITNFGGIIVSLKVPDRSGKLDDVVLGYDQLDGYLTNKAFFGAIVGRYANRIAHGKFVLNGVTYNIPKNDGDNALHGGLKGFNKRLWTAKDVSGGHGQAVELTYLSADGEEGFPET